MSKFYIVQFYDEEGTDLQIVSEVHWSAWLKYAHRQGIADRSTVIKEITFTEDELAKIDSKAFEI